MMKATIRHILNPPAQTPPSLEARVKQSNSWKKYDQDGNIESIRIPSQRSVVRSKLLPLSKIVNLDIHPSLPIICYVDCHGGGGNSDVYKFEERRAPKTSSQNSTTSTTNISPQSQRIIIQNFLTNHTVGVIHIRDIARSLKYQGVVDEHVHVDEETVSKACQDLGFIISAQFIDPFTVRHHSGYIVPPQSQPRGISSSYIDGDFVQFKSESSSYLIIQWSSRIMIWPISLKTMKVLPSIQTSICEITPYHLNNATPTSMPIPMLSTDLLAIGCSDGAVRFFSQRRGKVVKSVRGPNGRGDAVVRIVSMNVWNWSSLNALDDACSLDVSQAKDDMNSKEGTIRILTVCASGYAYLWEMEIACHRAHGGHVKHIRAPLVKIDGFHSLEKKNIPSSPSRSNAAERTSSNTNESYNVEYDKHRQLLFWTNKSNVVVWDFHDEALPKATSRSINPSMSGRAIIETPLHHPQQVVRIDGTDGAISRCNTLLMHPHFQGSTVAFMSGSMEGDLTIMTSSCESRLYDRQIPLRESSADYASANTVEKAIIYHKFSMASMQQSSKNQHLGLIQLLNGKNMKLRALSVSPSRPDIMMMTTNVGVLVVQLMDDYETKTGTLHAAICQKGIGSPSGIISVQDSAVYLDYALSSQSIKKMKGYLPARKPVLVYNSPAILHGSDDFQHTKHVRLRPRILTSPSGNFVCLFWHSENRYEILHVASIFTAAKKMAGNNSDEFSPMVDTGYNVKSFAWVGDSDVFALLHPPETNHKVELAQNEDSSSIMNGRQRFSSVELKVLVGVNADAMKLSGCSVAAATAKTINRSLDVRGRHPPSCLFGGPVLCIGSLSTDIDNSQSDGMAHFYSKANDDEGTKQSYVSVGPSLPYPDTVVWDDNGKLCAFICSNRVAIYLSNPPHFTLVGTAFLGTDLESDIKVQCAKFLGRVLFCSTRHTIQCIFMGDFENEERMCEVDSYIVSSSLAYTTIGQPGIGLEPHPLPIPLLNPSPLMYFNGSLLVSTPAGLCAVPLSPPLFRIGILLAGGHQDKAQHWFEAIDPIHHESLATFLERRGWPELAIQLPGLSLESVIDICLRNRCKDQLEHIIESFGLETIRQIDSAKRVGDGSHSLTVCLGAFFLSVGCTELVRRMATDSITLSSDGRYDAFELATLLLAVDPQDAKRLIKRALFIQRSSASQSTDAWILGDFIKESFLVQK